MVIFEVAAPYSLFVVGVASIFRVEVGRLGK
jgi:hypothetical protein